MLNFPLLVLSLLTCGSIYCWYQRIVAVGNHRPILEHRACDPKPFGLIDIAIMFFTWGLVQFVAVQAGLSFAGISGAVDDTSQLTADQQTSLMLSSGLGLLLATGIAMGIIGARYQDFAALFGLQRKNLRLDLKIGIVAFLMVLPIVLGIQWLLSYLVDYDHETIRLFQENFSLRTALVSWFTAVFVAPICEEVFFRGLVQGWLQRISIGADNRLDVKAVIGGWPEMPVAIVSGNPSIPSGPHPGVWFWMPIVFSSLLFALAHFGQGLAPIPLFLFGMVLGYLYRCTGSLIPCIVVHFLLNAFTMFTLTLEMI